jgi:hypothetical protein
MMSAMGILQLLTAAKRSARLLSPKYRPTNSSVMPRLQLMEHDRKVIQIVGQHCSGQGTGSSDLWKISLSAKAESAASWNVVLQEEAAANQSHLIGPRLLLASTDECSIESNECPSTGL